MKKKWALVLAISFLLTFTFTACSNGSSSEPKEPKDYSTSTTAIDSSKETSSDSTSSKNSSSNTNSKDSSNSSNSSKPPTTSSNSSSSSSKPSNSGSSSGSKPSSSSSSSSSNSSSTSSGSKSDASTHNSDSPTVSELASESNAVVAYVDEMQGYYNTLAEAMDEAYEAHANGDLEAANAALEKSNEAWGKVLRSEAPSVAKDVDIRMRQASASMNLLVAFFADATDALVAGDVDRYAEDTDEIMTVIEDVQTDSENLSVALKDLTSQYQQ